MMMIPLNNKHQQPWTWPKNLPTSMYFEIRKFLSIGGYWKFLITSKYFNQIKYETRKIILNDEEIMRNFFNDESIQKYYLDQIKSPYDQLRLKVPQFFLPEYPIKADLILRFDYLLTFPSLSIPNLSDRKYIHIEGHSSITDFNGLYGVDEMKLKELKYLVDITGLKNLYSLTLTSCHSLTDVSCLGHLHKLAIERCGMVTSVLGLENVHRLRLSFLMNLLSLAPSMDNDRLEIYSCEKIVDQAPLRGVRILATDLLKTFQDCDNLLHENTRTQSITFINYQDKVAHPSLAKMKSVSFHAGNITNIESLNNIPNLLFESCKFVDISTLTSGNKIQSIALKHCNNLSNFTSLQNILSITIMIDYSEKFLELDLTIFQNTRHLSLGCHGIWNMNQMPLSFKGINKNRIEHLELLNLCIQDIPSNISKLVLHGYGFAPNLSYARVILEEASCPRIILRGYVMNHFRNEMKGREKMDSKTGIYEIIHDSLDNQTVLLKIGENTSSSWTAFGVLPPAPVLAPSIFGRNQTQGLVVSAMVLTPVSVPAPAPAQAFNLFGSAPIVAAVVDDSEVNHRAAIMNYEFDMFQGFGMT